MVESVSAVNQSTWSGVYFMEVGRLKDVVSSKHSLPYVGVGDVYARLKVEFVSQVDSGKGEADLENALIEKLRGFLYGVEEKVEPQLFRISELDDQPKGMARKILEGNLDALAALGAKQFETARLAKEKAFFAAFGGCEKANVPQVVAPTSAAAAIDPNAPTAKAAPVRP